MKLDINNTYKINKGKYKQLKLKKIINEKHSASLCISPTLYLYIYWGEKTILTVQSGPNSNRSCYKHVSSVVQQPRYHNQPIKVIRYLGKVHWEVVPAPTRNTGPAIVGFEWHRHTLSCSLVQQYNAWKIISVGKTCNPLTHSRNEKLFDQKLDLIC